MIHKNLAHWILIFTIFCVSQISVISPRGANGGVSCAACTIIIGLGEQLAEIRNLSIINGTKEFCTKLPKITQESCFYIAEKVEPLFLDESLHDLLTPDTLCYAIGSCYKDDDHDFCHLFPRPRANFRNSVRDIRNKFVGVKNVKFEVDFCKLPVIKQICEVFGKSLTTLDPVQDYDKDGFSVINTARGFNWRGKDCRDWDPNTYPGRSPKNQDIVYDSNCNGIWGTDPETLTPWEDILCNESESQGLIYIGDSIGAHFHFPEVWMNPLIFSMDHLDNSTNDVLNELDWPQLGFATGFKNISQTNLISGLTDSLYWRLRNRNRCNHRDYQNLSQNGAATFNIPNHIQTISRNQTIDKPAIVFYAFMGNDVCNQFQDTISNMTSPEEFKNNVLEVLQVLDTKLPKGSHVILIGLIDGSFIYPQMAERVHPLGSLHGNILYKDLYKWFTCMEIGPCVGWMTPNETLREITSQRSVELTNVLQLISKTSRFQNFEIHFLENPIHTVLQTYNLTIWKYIEPVDSLHPTQKLQVLLTEVLWDQMLNKLPPDVLGPVNPFNEKIVELFGEQGGHD